ncbi:MAG: gluconokinase [Bifidobacterium breve]
MAAGHPLTDEDRWPWLDTIAAWIDERVAAGEPAVVTCSALKKIYRDKLRRQGVVFVYMQGTFDEVMERLSHRQGHFMKPSMPQSQSDILEEPGDRRRDQRHPHEGPGPGNAQRGLVSRTRQGNVEDKPPKDERCTFN